MFSASCVRARLRLQQRTAGLAPAEALRLEEHLSSCEACRVQAVQLDRLSALAGELDPSLRPAARERAIGRAFARAGAQWSAPRRAHVSHYFALGGGLAAALALGLVLWPRSAPAPSSSPGAVAHDRAATAVPAGAHGDRVLAGAVQARGRGLTSGASVEAGQELSATSGAELQLAHARVSLHADTRVQWNASEHALALIAGVVSVEVDPSRHEPFSVRTSRFRAEVLGTRFEVDLEGVRVERGTVRVVATDGQVLAPAVTAGQRFVFAEPAAAQEPSVATAALAIARDDRADPEELPRPGARRSQAARDADARALLQRARKQLTQRDAETAWHTVQDALALRPATALRAEARSLIADVYMVEGNTDRAVGEYLSIANKFEPRVAAQNALFAAGRLEAERGHDGPALSCFNRYVARYPHGALIEDARRRLQALKVATGHASPAKAPDAQP